jgi:cation:H+ antiporter
VAFTTYMVTLVRAQVSGEEKAEFGAEVAQISGEGTPRISHSLLLLTAGVALLGLGANATVTGSVGLARLVGMSERVIGLTIVSVGTSLPEVVTSLVSVIRGRADIAIGNIIGSNLFNILGILGLSSVVTALPVNPAIVHGDNWWMLGLTLLLFPLMQTGQVIKRWEGVVLFASYATYIGLLLARPA